ncbi:MAG: hypothetical protein NW200_00785 [Hyphomonadaceae bacterium]|nr:hypothetical protein [Hyphomonadaceae bacterium]
MQWTRSARRTGLMWLSMLALFLLGLGVGLVDETAILRWSPWLWIGVIAAVMAFATALCVYWMGQIDELAQRAHYVAWFWGGSFALGALLFVILAGPALVQVVDFAALTAPFEDRYGDAAGFIAGVYASVFALTVGYGLWWIVYWVRKQ